MIGGPLEGSVVASSQRATSTKISVLESAVSQLAMMKATAKEVNFEDFLPEEGEQDIVRDLTRTICDFVGSNERQIDAVRLFDEKLSVDEYTRLLRIVRSLAAIQDFPEILESIRLAKDGTAPSLDTVEQAAFVVSQLEEYLELKIYNYKQLMQI